MAEIGYKPTDITYLAMSHHHGDHSGNANDYASATVQDILDEAGLSTRAFYRHFGSKDDLFHALFRREAELVAERGEHVALGDEAHVDHDLADFVAALELEIEGAFEVVHDR